MRRRDKSSDVSTADQVTREGSTIREQSAGRRVQKKKRPFQIVAKKRSLSRRRKIEKENTNVTSNKSFIKPTIYKSLLETQPESGDKDQSPMNREQTVSFQNQLQKSMRKHRVVRREDSGRKRSALKRKKSEDKRAAMSMSQGRKPVP